MSLLKLILFAAALLILASFHAAIHAALARPAPGRMARVASGVGWVVGGIVIGAGLGGGVTAVFCLFAFPNPLENHGSGYIAALTLTVMGGLLGVVLGALAGGWRASRNG